MLTEIRLHGNVWGKDLKQIYKLQINSPAEAFHAINILSKKRFYDTLLENDKKGIEYNLLINGRDFLHEEEIDEKKPETILKSEIVMRNSNIKTIDVLPVIEGSDSASILAIIGGIGLIIGGIFVSLASFGGATPLGIAMIIGGIGLLAAGVINLLSPPPKFEDFREIQGGGRQSYLFNGPENTINEGGPVPIVYGRILIGSHVIATSYSISDQDAGQTITV